jgi:MbtH protein
MAAACFQPMHLLSERFFGEVIWWRWKNSHPSPYLSFKRRPEVDNSEDKTIYKAVMNHEEQYSIWPAHRELPLGWKDAGKTGTKAECLEYIGQVWTDMRPLSLRIKMEQAAQSAK